MNKNIITLFLMTGLFLTGCGRKNIIKPPPEPEIREFIINEGTEPKMVMKVERVTHVSLSTNEGSEMIRLSVKSINSTIDSINLRTLLKTSADVIIYTDTNKLFHVNETYQLIDSFTSVHYKSTIDEYTVENSIIKNVSSQTGTYQGFAEILSDTIQYYKPFNCSITADHKIICVIDNDTLKRFDGYIYNDSLITAKFFSQNDSTNLDFSNCKYKIVNNTLSVNIDFTGNANPSFDNLKIKFNGTK